ncbi:uncharacterized [Tachysurus ichikawai]
MHVQANMMDHDEVQLILRSDLHLLVVGHQSQDVAGLPASLAFTLGQECLVQSALLDMCKLTQRCANGALWIFPEYDSTGIFYSGKDCGD